MLRNFRDIKDKGDIMAIFNETVVNHLLDDQKKTIDLIAEGKIGDKIKSRWDKYCRDNNLGKYEKPNTNVKKETPAKDKSSEKKKGMLTKQDFENGLSLFKQVFGSDSMVGKYIECESINEIFNDYSKSDRDFQRVAYVNLANTEDPYDDSVLIPSDDSDWYDEHNTDFKKHCDKVFNHLGKLCEKLDKECAKRYADVFEFDLVRNWYAYIFYIDSKKPKESSESNNK